MAAHPHQLGDAQQGRPPGHRPVVPAVAREQRSADQDRRGACRSGRAAGAAHLRVAARDGSRPRSRAAARALSRGDGRGRQLRCGPPPAAARAVRARTDHGRPRRPGGLGRDAALPRLLRLERAGPAPADRQRGRGDGRSDARLRGDEPAGAAQSAVRFDRSGVGGVGPAGGPRSVDRARRSGRDRTAAGHAIRDRRRHGPGRRDQRRPNR